MTQTHSRYIQVGDLYFELKSVRALKVDEYGKPYSAIANCNINGDKMYVDGLLTQNGEELSKKDFLSFYQFCQKIGIDTCSYHRFQDGESIHKEVSIEPNKKVTVEKTAQDFARRENITSSEELIDRIPMRLIK